MFEKHGLEPGACNEERAQKKNGEHFPLLRKKPQGIYRGDAVLKQPARELQQAKQLLLWARLSHIMCVTTDVYNSPYNNIPMIL